MNQEKICQYCRNEIRPLDRHAILIKRGNVVQRPDNPEPIVLQDVTCELTRTVIAKIEQMK